ncbi:MAG: ABC transporter substrate-binding protein, partial [Casimicrobium sp.]
MNLCTTTTFSHIVAARLCGVWFAALLAPALLHAEIVIGQSIPKSGNLAAQGDAITKGATAYFNRINASGGINGQPIKLISLDDGGDAKRTVENAKKLIGDGAVAL